MFPITDSPHPPDPPPRGSQHLGLDQAEARSWGIPPGIPWEWQGLQLVNFLISLLPPRALELGAELGQEPSSPLRDAGIRL